MILSEKRITKVLIRLRRCAGWSASVLFATPLRQVFSREDPYIGHVQRNGQVCSPSYRDYARLLKIWIDNVYPIIINYSTLTRSCFNGALKQNCPATETSWNPEILHIASIAMVRLGVCTDLRIFYWLYPDSHIYIFIWP